MHHTLQVATVTTPTDVIVKAKVVIETQQVTVADRRGRTLFQLWLDEEPYVSTLTAGGEPTQPTWVLRGLGQKWTAVDTGGCGCGGTTVTPR